MVPIYLLRQLKSHSRSIQHSHQLRNALVDSIALEFRYSDQYSLRYRRCSTNRLDADNRRFRRFASTDIDHHHRTSLKLITVVSTIHTDRAPKLFRLDHHHRSTHIIARAYHRIGEEERIHSSTIDITITASSASIQFDHSHTVV